MIGFQNVVGDNADNEKQRKFWLKSEPPYGINNWIPQQEFEDLEPLSGVKYY
jgi:hypothetical protein